MSYTLEELKEKLVEEYDETILLEILQISAEDIVDRFEDKIYERYDSLISGITSEEDQETENSL